MTMIKGHSQITFANECQPTCLIKAVRGVATSLSIKELQVLELP